MTLKLNDEEKELFGMAILNDSLDVLLFVIGVIIPFTGDLIESIIGGIFDILLLVWMFKDEDIHYNAIWIFLLETLDITDFITMGQIDILGWIEVIPFWVIGFWYFKSQKTIKTLKETITKIEGIPLDKNKDLHCKTCGSNTTPEMKICEKCGTELKKEE